MTREVPRKFRVHISFPIRPKKEYRGALKLPHAAARLIHCIPEFPGMEELIMSALVVATLLIHSLATVAVAVGSALADILPGRR